jgi:glutamyl-tRNA reductase
MTADTGTKSDPVPSPGLEGLVLAGVDHRTAGQGLRDRLFVEEVDLPDFYRRLGEAGLGQAVLLSTCDRVVVVAICDQPVLGATLIRCALAEAGTAQEQSLEGSFFSLTGREALGHLFSIAASLESQILGEPEVLGQVKEAYRLAAPGAGAGSELGRVFEAAFALAKRVRSETPIGENAVSMAAAACQVAREVLGRFEEATGLIIGAGEIGVLVAEKLTSQGLADLWVADPLEPRAEALAARLGAHRLAVNEIADALPRMDIVLAGLGGAAPVITRETTANALKQRRFKPIFMLDGAVPADIEPAVAELDEAYLFTLHDLERIALTGWEKRSRAALEARQIVEEEVAGFTMAEGQRAAAPAVTALRAHFESVRAELLAENPGLSAEEATRLLIARLLHGPSEVLRELAAGSDGEAALDEALIARLFGVAPLPDDGPPENEKE